jgi:hypothetical protein
MITRSKGGAYTAEEWRRLRTPPRAPKWRGLPGIPIPSPVPPPPPTPPPLPPKPRKPPSGRIIFPYGRAHWRRKRAPTAKQLKARELFVREWVDTGRGRAALRKAQAHRRALASKFGIRKGIGRRRSLDILKSALYRYDLVRRPLPSRKQLRPYVYPGKSRLSSVGLHRRGAVMGTLVNPRLKGYLASPPGSRARARRTMARWRRMPRTVAPTGKTPSELYPAVFKPMRRHMYKPSETRGWKLGFGELGFI